MIFPKRLTEPLKCQLLIFYFPEVHDTMITHSHFQQVNNCISFRTSAFDLEYSKEDDLQHDYKQHSIVSFLGQKQQGP